jgi:hypothetical protein
MKVIDLLNMLIDGYEDQLEFEKTKTVFYRCYSHAYNVCSIHWQSCKLVITQSNYLSTKGIG